ncbi:hypothetical protein Drorol1_Dr00001832 [Drosera rotundifolia]
MPPPLSPLPRSLSTLLRHHLKFSAAAASPQLTTPLSIPILKPHLPTLSPSADADLIAGIILDHHNPFHPLESSLQLDAGITFSPHLISQTLLRLRHHSKLALSFFSWAQAQARLHQARSDLVDVGSVNLMVEIMGRVRQFDVAWELILRSQSNCSTFLVLIRRLIAAGLTRQAIRAWDDMPALVQLKDDDGNVNDHDGDDDGFVYVIDSLCKYGYVRAAMEVFRKRNRRWGDDGVGAKVYTVLVYGWCKVKRVDMAEKMLREMIEEGIEPNVVTYNVLLNGICRRASLHPETRFEGVIRAAERVLEEMKERGIEPDVTSYSILLHVYSRAHRPELTLEKLEVMKGNGICPNVATYTSAIKCLSSCGRLEEAERLLDEMVANGVSPSAVTYNCFFKEFRGRKNVEGAIGLYRKMKTMGSCMPDMHTYHILLGMFLNLDKMGIVKELWNDIKSSGVGPELDTYTMLIHGLIEKQKWRHACAYFVEMIEKGFLPQKVTFETLYRGLIQADKLRTWRRLKKKLDEESISFSSEFENYHLQPYRR